MKISQSSNVRVEVYTLQGEKIAELFDEYVNAEELISVKCALDNVYSDSYLVCVIHTVYGTVTKPMLIRN